MGAIQDLNRRYAERADVHIVYIREAHPLDGWRLESNDEENVCIPSARTAEDRAAAAREMCRRSGMEMQVLLDTMTDAVAESYSAFPDRLYLIDRDGRVAHKGGRGPFGFDVEALERALLLSLVEEDCGPGTSPGEAAPR